MADPADVVSQVRAAANPMPAAVVTARTEAGNTVAAKPVQSFAERLAAVTAAAAAAAKPAVEAEANAPAPPAPVIESKPRNPPQPAKPVEAKPVEAPQEPTAAAAPEPDAPAAEPEAPAVDDKLAKRFAELQRAQRRHDERVRAERQALAKEKAELDAARAERQKLEEMKKRAKEDPIAWLKEGGLTFDEAALSVINGKQKPPPTPEEREAALAKELEEKLLAKIRTETEERRKAEDKAAEDARRAAIVRSVVERVNASDKYPFTKLRGEGAAVFEYAVAVFERGDAKRGIAPKTDLPFDKAAEIVEGYLRQQAEEQVGKERVAAFLGIATAAPAQEASKSTPAEAVAGKTPGKTLGKTLSNGKATASAGDEDWTKLPLEERKRRAAQLLRGARK